MKMGKFFNLLVVEFEVQVVFVPQDPKGHNPEYFSSHCARSLPPFPGKMITIILFASKCEHRVTYNILLKKTWCQQKQRFQTRRTTRVINFFELKIPLIPVKSLNCLKYSSNLHYSSVEKQF